ncbi:hypothetical protein ATK36_5634 [Amycolatopsis sulphurea]|uniref:Uncharacterized protein n=1 Tax=Amycolatopsis sulphurea TaxID=76022 RepID=A0A2A9FHL8_9PSEU|nr:hypothetical protein ATK36_5634 [Amycolatopsis sulphurea]
MPARQDAAADRADRPRAAQSRAASGNHSPCRPEHQRQPPCRTRQSAIHPSSAKGTARQIPATSARSSRDNTSGCRDLLEQGKPNDSYALKHQQPHHLPAETTATQRGGKANSPSDIHPTAAKPERQLTFRQATCSRRPTNSDSAGEQPQGHPPGSTIPQARHVDRPAITDGSNSAGRQPQDTGRAENSSHVGQAAPATKVRVKQPAPATLSPGEEPPRERPETQSVLDAGQLHTQL